MKDSERLKNELEKEDNDLKAMGIFTKVLRAERDERFDNYKDKILEAGFDIDHYPDLGKYTISPTEYGIIDYFPKANKLLIRKQNKWHQAGLRWIIRNLL